MLTVVRDSAERVVAVGKRPRAAEQSGIASSPAIMHVPVAVVNE